VFTLYLTNILIRHLSIVTILFFYVFKMIYSAHAYIILYRFCELLMEFGGCEDSSEIVLESLDTLMAKPGFTPEHYSQGAGGKAASELCSWLRGVHSLHSILQTKIRPLQSKIGSMQASLAEYSEKLKVQDNKIRVLEKRLTGLRLSLESASVEKSRQRELVRTLQRECQHTNQFITVSELPFTFLLTSKVTLAKAVKCNAAKI